MRHTTVEVMRATARAGSADSAAAIVTISAPIIEKNTVTPAASTASGPFGTNPPCAVRLPKVGVFGPMNPHAYEAASAMNTMIAATLIEANQNSNSPYERADIRLTLVMIAIRPMPSAHSGTGSQEFRIAAPAIASTGITITQKYQYSQPTENPAQLPRPARANSVKERTCGMPTAISPSIRMISSTRNPHTA